MPSGSRKYLTRCQRPADLPQHHRSQEISAGSCRKSQHPLEKEGNEYDAGVHAEAGEKNSQRCHGYYAVFEYPQRYDRLFDVLLNIQQREQHNSRELEQADYLGRCPCVVDTAQR